MYNVFESEANLVKVDAADATTRYIGIGGCGSSDDAEAWKIIKETLDDSGNLIMSQTYKTLAAWDDRENLEF